MSTLYLMCGLPFSGKSTLARRIVERLACAQVSLDEINAERGLEGGDGIPVEEWEKTHQIALARLGDLLRAGSDIVLDDTSCFRWIRNRFRSVADDHGYRTLVIHLDIPIPLLRERMAHNATTHERSDIRSEVFEAVAAMFEPPGDDETSLRITAPEGVMSWLDAHVASAATG